MMTMWRPLAVAFIEESLPGFELCVIGRRMARTVAGDRWSWTGASAYTLAHARCQTDSPGSSHRACAPEGGGPEPGARFLLWRARVRADAEFRPVGRFRFRGWLPSSHRAEYLGEPGRGAA